jgi:hypothetical protein
MSRFFGPAVPAIAAAAVVLLGSGCGGQNHSAVGAPASPQPSTSEPPAQVHYDMQEVEGCFIGGGQNTDEAPDDPFFDLVDLSNKAVRDGQGAFSTFPNTFGTDNSTYYFFTSHEQAVDMSKLANLDAHTDKLRVIGNVIVAWYADLDPAEQALQDNCLSAAG